MMGARPYEIYVKEVRNVDEREIVEFKIKVDSITIKGVAHGNIPTHIYRQINEIKALDAGSDLVVRRIAMLPEIKERSFELFDAWIGPYGMRRDSSFVKRMPDGKIYEERKPQNLGEFALRISEEIADYNY